MRRRLPRWSTPLLWLLWVLPVVAAGEARAQAPADAAADPPARVGRLAYVDGSVSLQPAGVPDWNAAPLNEPLTQGDTVWSDAGGRAEIDLGDARVRMDQLTDLGIIALDDRSIQLRLQAGSVDIAVSDVADLDWFEIDAPSATVALVRPGEYRLTVDNAGTTSIAVRSGLAQVLGTNPRDPVEPGAPVATGERGLFGIDGAYAVTQAGPPDAFDLWAQQRQAQWNQDQTVARYVSSDAVGYQDLASYGQWQQQPDAGPVWFPTDVAVDWVPYSTGNWAWINRWGWSWVDSAPWGFAPFHYGRWGRFGGRWGWVPCPANQRAIYAPALVAWIGGPGVPGAAALGGGPAVGWLPLAPGEVYIPAYDASPRYLLNVNLTNSRQLSAAQIRAVASDPARQSHYANQDIPGALTVVPQVSFTSGQSVARNRMSPPSRWQSVAPLARAPAIAPERASVVGALTLSRIGTPPGTLLAHPVLARHTPPASLPPFEQQLTAIRRNGGHPLDTARLAAPRTPDVGAVRDVGGRRAAAGSTGSLDNRTYRGIPERAPESLIPPPVMNENVFERRTQQIEQERAAAQPQPAREPRPATPPPHRASVPRFQPERSGTRQPATPVQQPPARHGEAAYGEPARPAGQHSAAPPEYRRAPPPPASWNSTR